jgi:hypothetical protein
MSSSKQGFVREPYIESFVDVSSSVKLFVFEDRNTDKICCWSPAKMSAAEFCKRNVLSDRGEKVFAGPRPHVKMFFPIDGQYFVQKTVRLRGVATIETVLTAVQEFIVDAVRYVYGESVEGVEKYEQFVTCHFMISRAGGHNKLYIRTPA